MFTSVGVAASVCVAAALIVGVSIIPTIGIQLLGKRLRGKEKSVGQKLGAGSTSKGKLEVGSCTMNEMVYNKVSMCST